MLPVQLSAAVLVCFGALVSAYDYGYIAAHTKDDCPGTTTHQGVENMIHGQFACVAGSGGKRFLRCYLGRVDSWDCPDDTLFNMKRNVCDHPEKLDCDTRPPPQDCHNAETSEGVKDLSHGEFACVAGSGGKRFMRCSLGQVKSYNCPDYTMFNLKLNVCVHPEQMDCVNPPPQDCHNADTSEGVRNLRHGQWACRNAKGTLFSRCWGGRVYDFACTVGTGMNTALGRCQWPGNIDCSL